MSLYLIAHVVGIDYRLPLIELDMQLALVEFAVPLVFTIGTIDLFLATLFILIQAENNGGHFKLERPAISMLVAGPALWLLGSIHNSCKVYEMESVLIPFLMWSLFFLVGAILNTQEHLRHVHHGLELLGGKWVWFGIVGSLILFIGAMANVFKVFKMQENELRLEKFRGGAHEHLMGIRDQGYTVPFVVEEAAPLPTPYKDVPVGTEPI